MNSESHGLKALAFLRVMMGAFLIWQILPNLDHSFIERLPERFYQFAQANPWSQYRWILHHVAIPYVETIGTVISVGQFLTGIALVLGFLTRPVLVLSLIYVLNLYLATAHFSGFHQSFSLLLGIVFLGLFIADAGRFYGADGFIFKGTSGEALSKPKNKFKNKKQKELVEQLAKQLKTSSSSKKKIKSLVKAK